MNTAQTITITGQKRLSNSGFHRCGGNSSGAAHWWLKDSEGDFMDLPTRVRGDAKEWSLDVELPVGSYILGTGRGKDAIREVWEVTADGKWI